MIRSSCFYEKIQKRLYTGVLIGLISAFSTGCHPLFCPWELGYSQLTDVPPQKELIGKYFLSKKSSSLLANEGFNINQSELELKDDMQFVLTDVPETIVEDPYSTSKSVISRTGTWSMNCGESYDCMIELHGIGVFPLSEKGGILAVPITMGDGDECRGIVFEKK
ncbi:hypothetical protein GZH53_05650 [Flavihumibacter sp. R14]|nr:hypothetical protein [Flavihumibacter soli]